MSNAGGSVAFTAGQPSADLTSTEARHPGLAANHSVIENASLELGGIASVAYLES